MMLIRLFFFVFVTAIILISGSYAQTYSLQKDSTVYGLQGLDQIPCYHPDSLDIHGLQVPAPLWLDWCRNIDVDSTRRVILLYSFRNGALDAWFVQDSLPNLGKLKGADRVAFTENDLLFGISQLLPPLLPANNLTDDTLRSSFTCLDRSFNFLRHYSLDWNTFAIVEDSTTELGWYGGQYGPAVYCQGSATGHAAGYLFYKPTANSWRFFSFDTTLALDKQYTPFNHTGFYHYSAGAVTPVADDIGDALQFILLHPRNGRLYRFHNGYGMTLFETESGAPDRPTLLAAYPMDEWPTVAIDTTLNTQYYRYPLKKWQPIEVDRLGQLWYAPPAPQRIYVIPDALFPQRNIYNAPPPTHQALTIPSSLPAGQANVLFIDGTRSGKITLLMSGGVETFSVDRTP